MERAERTGFGLAVAGHVILFGLLSVGFLATPNPLKLKQQPIEVSLVKDVGLEATAPQSVTPPAQSVAPDQGDPEEAAPPPPQQAPASEPQPQAAPPQPREAPPAPAAPPRPAPAAKPAPVPPKPQPKPAAAKPAPAKAPPTKQASAATRSDSLASVMRGIGSGDTKAARPRGSRLGDNFLKGLTTEPNKSTSTTPRAAKIDARAMASIVQAIARQIQPCADRQVNPGPGANQIVTTLSLKLNPDGTLAATPRMVRQTGVDGDNGRYAQRVVDLGVAAFKGCSPLKLPAEYYSTPSGGWNNINYQWQLR